jgi:3-deoxy-D-manno-octulosonic-acid transferase
VPSTHPVCVTIFSPSAKKSIERLRKRLQDEMKPFVYLGYSPSEEAWENFFAFYRVVQVNIAKYEAWPGLWSALVNRSLPVVYVQAQVRSSLLWAKKMLSVFGFEMPRFYFLGSRATDLEHLKGVFPASQISLVSDPRWVQVSNRAKLPHPRVEALKMNRSTQGKVGVLGSIWMSDLHELKHTLDKIEGQVWVVPHDTSEKNIQDIESFLSPLGSVVKTRGQAQVPSAKFFLVNEIGFLLELYSIADWGWVGGGWEQGVHSTLEPQFFGLPVGCGPKNTNFFPEIDFGVQRGQLRVCQTRSDLESFFNFALHASSAQRATWRKSCADEVKSFGSWVEQWLRIR